MTPADASPEFRPGAGPARTRERGPGFAPAPGASPATPTETPDSGERGPRSSSERWILFGMSTLERGKAMRGVAGGLGLEAVVLAEVEELLFRTRAAVPDAMVLEHKLVERVPQLDLVALLRRRKPLAEVPIVYLGPDRPEVHAAALESGVDAYLTLPTRPEVVEAYLRRLTERRRSEGEMRATLERLRDFERAYRESERVKDDLTHMLVHDLKSPISSVMGLLDHSLEMIAATGSPDGIDELLSLARSESQHLLNLAANILDVRRMKEGHLPCDPQPIESLSALAKEALGDVSGAPRQRHFSFVIRPEAERVVADRDLLRRILANLFSNAIKHTRRDGYIDLRAERRGDEWLLSVRDDGEGIPEADQKRIFNAFEQSRHTVHDRYDTGMGLTFCKLAVEKHGGRIWVDSKVGRGSTFSFSLPAGEPGRDPGATLHGGDVAFGDG